MEQTARMMKMGVAPPARTCTGGHEGGGACDENKSAFHGLDKPKTNRVIPRSRIESVMNTLPFDHAQQHTPESHPSNCEDHSHEPQSLKAEYLSTVRHDEDASLIADYRSQSDRAHFGAVQNSLSRW